MKSHKKSKKRQIYFPTLFVILLVIFGIPGFLTLYFTRETIKNCTNEVTGIVDHEGEGELREISRSVEGKYVGNDRKYWIVIYVNTDATFKYETLYAGNEYGSEGDKLTIHYNPVKPDEYYIGDYSKLNGFIATVVLLVLSGIMLVLSIFTSIYFTFKEDTKKEKEIRQAKKKQKEEARIQKARNRLEEKTKRYAKNYTNPYIRKKFQDKIIGFEMLIWMMLIGTALCSFSIVKTSLNIYVTQPIPFDNYPDDIDDTFYSVVIDEKPIEVCDDGTYSKYYDLKVGNDHILAVNFDKKKIFGMDDSAKLRGKLKRIRVASEETRALVKEYYQEIGYYDTLKDEEYAYYYLDCSKISLWDELRNSLFFIAFVFGLTFIIIALLLSSDLLYMIKLFVPACSGNRYQAKEIDRLANDNDTIWLNNLEVLVTPQALIGLKCGMTIIDYYDIYGIRVVSSFHTSKYKKWYTYHIIIETKKHREMLLTETGNENDYKTLARYLDERFVEYIILDK